MSISSWASVNLPTSSNNCTLHSTSFSSLSCHISDTLPSSPTAALFPFPPSNLCGPDRCLTVKSIKPTLDQLPPVFTSNVLQTSLLPKLMICLNELHLVNLKRDYLAAQTYRAEKDISMANSRLQHLSAEKFKAAMHLQEAHVLQNAKCMGFGSDFVTYDAQSSVDLAKAALDSLKAEELVAKCRIQELKEELSLMEDKLDEVRRKVEEASRQYGHIQLALQTANLTVRAPLEYPIEYPHLSDLHSTL
ncbi:hypothetical protein CPB84DRAFT_1856009 [Gymnopilus junonius]|uniref:Uncharacterized protein n=1 Tax=Gymnopilus junonius TaxID=109634 RepID=A0A9P5TF83_GYMJU|nr:hypothetical protein CPB84DRAFT_1856009 [Gymnopilus junonius]